MRIVGVSGGVASGKSLVTSEFARLGAGVLDADRAGHEALCLPHVEEAARKRWGPEIFGEDGRIDRRRLAHIVFAPPPAGGEERRYLEQLTHPEIGRLLRAQAAQLASQGKVVAILDAALLFEAGWDKLCSTLVFVDTPRDVRLQRALSRGWSEQEFVARESAQRTVDWKRERADVLIENSGPVDATRVQVERVWPLLLA